MKISKTRAIFCLVFAAALLLCVSCAKDGSGDAGTKKEESISPEGIVGRWSVGEGERLNSNMPEIWEFTSDGRFIHSQTDGQGNSTGKVEGTYAIDGNKLTLTIEGWEQPACTVSFPDNDTMRYTDHEKTAELKRVK